MAKHHYMLKTMCRPYRSLTPLPESCLEGKPFQEDPLFRHASVAVQSEPSREDETSDDRKTDEEHQWTTVQRKKNRGRRTTSPRPHRLVQNMLNPERAKAVREAERLLNMPQCENIERRRRTVNVHC